MYEAYFGLRSRPFNAAPLAERYFPGSTIESARQVLARCVERSEGAGLLVGPAGTGKSLLGLILAEQFRNTLDVAYLASGRLQSRRELLQAILFEMGLPYRGLEEGELRLSLIDYLSQPASGRNGLLLFVDEAHTLPLRLLEELRLMTNLVRNGQPRVRVVLAGGPLLEERFTNPKLEAFNQRLAARCYLDCLERHETMDYVRSQIRAAGGQADQVFHGDALDAVHRATDGIPRLINQVCDHGLILAFAGGARQLTKAIIEEAWADLQQLPTPWNTAAGAEEKTARSDSDNIIEFGTLDGDEGEDEPAAVPFRAAVAAAPLALATSVEDEMLELTEDLEPTEQLAQIQSHLSSLEDEFPMAGPPTKTVDVVYPPANHPFQEAFEEEEVVVDRYAALEADMFKNQPRVRSQEGQELARLLNPFVQSTPEIAKRQVAKPPVSEFAAATMFVEATLAEATPAATTVLNAADITMIDDSDLLVIEDEPQEVTVSAPVARKQEYRQLFAKLRRG